MNDDLIFWRNWTFKEKALFWASICIVFGLALAATWGYFKGFDLLASVDVVTELKEKAISSPPLYLNDLSFSATTPLWYVEEYYLPGLVNVNPSFYYLFLAGLWIGVSLILIGLSRLQGVWFLLGAVLLAGLIGAFRLENLYLTLQKYPFIIAFAGAGLLYYFSNFYARKLQQWQAALLWIILGLGFAVLVHYTSVINKPFAALASFGLLCGLIITLFYIFFTAHEILSALYTWVSSISEKGKSSMGPFLVVSAVFIMNAVLIYLENSKRIPASFFVFSPYLILLINGILGWWGFHQLSQQRAWFSYRGVGAWVYLGLSIVALATLGIAYLSSNTPLVELLEDTIAICFLACGVCFMVYTLVNFLQPIKTGLPFSKIIYKPPFSRFLLARLAAAFVVVFLFSLKNRYSFYQLQAGLSNAVADFYSEEGDFRSAEIYYKSAANYDLNNLRSSLSLASMAYQSGDYTAALFYFKQANAKQANALASIGESSSLEKVEMVYDAVFALKENQAINDARIYTNLARLQNKLGITDSVLLQRNLALEAKNASEVERVNFLHFWIENGKVDKLLEMKEAIKEGKGYSYKANASAIDRLTFQDISFENFEIGQDSLLDMARAAYLMNALGYSKTENKTSIKGGKLLKIREYNDAFYEPLAWVYANDAYFRGNKISGIKQLKQLAASPSNLSPLYAQNLGFWFLQQGAVDAAFEELYQAKDTASVQLLKEKNLQSEFLKQQENQAKNLLKEVGIKNYSEVLNKAPLNPYLVAGVSDFLAKNNQNLEAYNVVFYTLDWVKNSPLLWETYVKRSIALGTLDYARDGIRALEQLGVKGNWEEELKAKEKEF